MALKSEVFSIFGEIEQFVAEDMIRQGLCKRIEVQDIPAHVRYNKHPITGEMRMAKFAMVIPGQLVSVYERAVANMRA